MTEENIEKLDAIEFNWAPMSSSGYGDSVRERLSARNKAIWEGHYSDLLAFHKKYGHCHVKRNNSSHPLAVSDDASLLFFIV